VVTKPVALDVDEIEDVDGGGLDGGGILGLGRSRQGGIQAFNG
jgi:hypothetical protein